MNKRTFPINFVSLFFMILLVSCGNNNQSSNQSKPQETKQANISGESKADTQVFKSPLGFKITYKTQPGTSVEENGLSPEGYTVFYYNSGMNLAAEIRVYDPDSQNEKAKKSAKESLAKDLQTFAKEEFNATGSPDCKKTNKPSYCENEASASQFKKITFAGQSAYSYQVNAQPMPFKMIYADFKNKRFIIKDIGGIGNFQFE